jgi:hypothetical protein
LPGQHLVQNQVDPFVPVGVELDPALLETNAAEVFVWIECQSGEVAFHYLSLFVVICMDQLW